MSDILPKAPNDKYQKLFDKLNEIDTLPISEDGFKLMIPKNITDLK